MIHIRAATETDLQTILHVQQQAFREYAGLYETSAWTSETLDSVKNDARDKHIAVAEADGAIVGSVRWWTVAGVWVLRLFYVQPN
jgi:predicted N-acetyltransferase YhbS